MYMYINNYFCGAEKWFLVMCRDDSQDVTITCYDVNTTVVTTARPTGRQFVVQFHCGCDVAAGDVLWGNYSLTVTLRRV